MRLFPGLQSQQGCIGEVWGEDEVQAGASTYGVLPLQVTHERWLRGRGTCWVGASPPTPGAAHTRLPADTLSVPIRDSRAAPVLFRQTVGG